MMERGFRKKIRYERPEKSEIFIQFSSRMRSYVNKWLKMAKAEVSYEAVTDFFARDQFWSRVVGFLFITLTLLEFLW